MNHITDGRIVKDGITYHVEDGIAYPIGPEPTGPKAYPGDPTDEQFNRRMRTDIPAPHYANGHSRAVVHPPDLPERTLTEDGLYANVLDTGNELRLVGELIEVKRLDEDDTQWRPCEGVVRHLLMNEVSKVAVCRKNPNSVFPSPWRVSPRYLEDRLLLAVAARHTVEGEHDTDIPPMREWARIQKPRQQGYKLSDGLKGAGFQDKHEADNRMPKHLLRKMRAVLETDLWTNKRTKIGGQCVSRWHPPANAHTNGPTINLKPSKG